MQGYILHKTSIKNQDLLLRVLTPNKLIELYRFYGMRHSIIDTGRKIDFDIQHNGYFIPKMRNILQLSYPWEKEYERVYVWKTFISLLNAHLKEIDELEDFYFDLLDWGAHILSKQHPMRVVIEMGVKLLLHEGRNTRHHQNICFVCEQELAENIALGRSFLFAHPRCINAEVMQKNKITQLLSSGSSVHLSDEEIEQIWNVFIQGL